MKRTAHLIRRAADIVAAVCGLIVTAPLVIVAAVVVRVTMGRGILFSQQRLGLAGHPFKLLKLRTMSHAQPGEEGPEFDELRMNRIGSLLRTSSIDEVPSLWNLLRGDITLVGPRPLPLHYFQRFRGDEYLRFEVKPGITGLAQVSGRNSVDWDERLALDVQYVNERSLLGDLRILLRTIPTVLGRGGISHGDAVTMHALPENRPEQATT